MTPTPIAVRQVDRTIAAVAAANEGRYSISLHLKHDPTATHAFAETHVRRLEAMRRESTGVERDPNGTWIIQPDHLDRVDAYERQRADRTPMKIETLSARSLHHQTGHTGVTWLDREMVSEHPVELGRGFGVDVRKAMASRQQWLIDQELAEQDGDTIRFRATMLASLQQRELVRVASQLSGERFW